MKFNLALPTAKWWMVLEHAAISAVAVMLTYVTQHLTAADFGTYGPIIVGVLSILGSIITKAANNDPNQVV